MTTSAGSSPAWVQSLQSTVAEIVTELFNLLSTGNAPLTALFLKVPIMTFFFFWDSMMTFWIRLASKLFGLWCAWASFSCRTCLERLQSIGHGWLVLMTDFTNNHLLCECAHLLCEANWMSYHMHLFRTLPEQRWSAVTTLTLSDRFMSQPCFL